MSDNSLDFLRNSVFVPDYESNLQLKREIAEALDGLLDFSRLSVLRRPKIIVFRLGDRPSDPFKEFVCPHIQQDDKVYLVFACRSQDQDISYMSELVPYDQRYKVKTFVIYIQFGRLVSCTSNKHQLSELAQQLSRDYDIQMRPQISRKMKVAIAVVVLIVLILVIVMIFTI